MKEASAAVQDLMRDTARLFDQASKLNAQVLQLDTFIGKDHTLALLKGLDECKKQYKESLERARSLAIGAESTQPGAAADGSNPDERLKALQSERDKLYAEAIEKSEQIRRLLDCVRQIQLTSAQLLQI
ncbi:hypothetical protein GQ54DRAFT_313448 [Martensiomyces pterosporus]|nr:hypothetical protein GQ54DRAFT_313448 [Martensiomyces pterosporus]